MCISALGQIVYGAVMFTATALTAVALFTSNWSQDVDDGNFGPQNIKPAKTSEGVMSYTCAKMYPDDTCDGWWDEIPDWQHVVLVFTWMAMFVEGFCVLWNILAFCTCCFKKFLLHPIIPLTLLATALMLIAVIVYGANGKDFIVYGHSPNSTESTIERGLCTQHNDGGYCKYPGTLGWSFWLAMSSSILDAIGFVLAILIVCFADKLNC